MNLAVVFPTFLFLLIVSCYGHGLHRQKFAFEEYIGKAYIITTKPSIPPEVRDVALRLGFQPVHLAAVLPYTQLYPTKQALCQACFYTNPPGGKVPESELTMGQLSLTCSTKKTLELISADTDAQNKSWSLILEDDVRLHPSLTDPRLEVIEGLQIYRLENQSYGFIYLGLCGGGCISSSSHKQSIGTNCHGYCGHAYMITKERASLIYRELYTSVNGKYPIGCGSKDIDACIPDTTYNFFFSPRPNMWVPQKDPPAPVVYVIGFNNTSPDEPSHRGLVYQDRSKVRKNVEEQESMVVQGSALLGMQSVRNLTCFKIRVSGNLGKMMFSYAFLVGVCLRNKVSPLHCASLSVHRIDRINGISPAEQFVQSFNLALPPCPIDGPFFHDHDHPKDVNSIRWRSDAGHQPSGTTYLGYFLSYKYFSSSEAQETVRDIYTFSKSFQIETLNRLRRLEMHMPGIFNENSMVCVAYPSSASLFMKKHPHLNPWIVSPSYYRLAIDTLKNALGTVFLVLVPIQVISNSEVDGHHRNIQVDGAIEKDILSIYNKSSSIDSLVMMLDDNNVASEKTALQVLSLCPNVIVSANTISWWGAFLNKYYTYIVAPAKILLEESKFNSDDYYPTNWTIVG